MLLLQSTLELSVHGEGFDPFSKPGLPITCAGAVVVDVIVSETVVVCVVAPDVPVTVMG